MVLNVLSWYKQRTQERRHVLTLRFRDKKSKVKSKVILAW